MQFNKLSCLSLICLLSAFFIFVFLGIKPAQKDIPAVEKNNYNKVSSNPVKTLLNANTGIDIAVNYPVSLSYKTKKEIYDIRKKYVEKSIFANSSYEPSEEVFGMIVDNKPWYSFSICRKPSGEAQVDGPSEEARFIVNPSVLVGLEYPFLWSDRQDSAFCTNPKNLMLPTAVSYYKSKNEIIVKYAKFPFESKGGYFYDFNGLNAADFGYRYAYVDLSKSTIKARFDEPENITNSVIEFQNFLHLGSSCGVSGGCNNGSPRQMFLEFHVEDFSASEIYIKLWRSRPNSYNDRPDIAERIIIGNI